MKSNEINPYTGKPLNPEIRIEKQGKVTVVAYADDYFKKTGIYDNRIGRGVRRLNQKLTPVEWKAVSRYFKDYSNHFDYERLNHKLWKWGTAEWDMVVIVLVKMRNPDVDHVVVRNKMTVKGVKELKKVGGNFQDALTGEYLIPVTE